jgi:peptide deformylase
VKRNASTQTNHPNYPPRNYPSPPETTRQRPTGVQIEAQGLTGKKFKMTLDGFEARVFQHEYDHLDGVLFHDRMAPEVLEGEVQKDLDELIAAHAEGEPMGL